MKKSLGANPKKYTDIFSKKEIALIIKEGKIPSRFVWHHHQNRGVLQLVVRLTHENTGHTGGKSIWGTK